MSQQTLSLSKGGLANDVRTYYNRLALNEVQEFKEYFKVF